MRGFAFAAWIAQATVVASAIVPSACSDACADEEDGDEDCSPRCPSCTCAHAQKPLLTAAAAWLEPRRDDVTHARERLAPDPPADPEPRGIFHPPRA